MNVWLRSSKVEEQGRQTSCVDKFESLRDKELLRVCATCVSGLTRSVNHYYYVVVDQI